MSPQSDGGIADLLHQGPRLRNLRRLGATEADHRILDCPRLYHHALKAAGNHLTRPISRRGIHALLTDWQLHLSLPLQTCQLRPMGFRQPFAGHLQIHGGNRWRRRGRTLIHRQHHPEYHRAHGVALIVAKGSSARRRCHIHDPAPAAAAAGETNGDCTERHSRNRLRELHGHRYQFLSPT